LQEAVSQLDRPLAEKAELQSQLREVNHRVRLVQVEGIVASRQSSK
jgi:hypothetical protein